MSPFSRVGEIRPSQLLWTFGVGSVLDLRHLSVIVTGVDQWPADGRSILTERRLLHSVRSLLGPEVEGLATAPIRLDGTPYDPNNRDGKAHVGVPVRTFPGWLRCPLCGLLAPADSGLFKDEPNPWNPMRARYSHEHCSKASGTRWPSAVPARHLVACEAGHIDDFPWHWYVHGGPSSCTGILRFYERGASAQAEDLVVQCETCGNQRVMAPAFRRPPNNGLPGCRGRHPHLETGDGTHCDQTLRTLLLGATNTWFPVTRGVLAVPSDSDAVLAAVEEHWDDLSEVPDRKTLDFVWRVVSKKNAGLAKLDVDQVWAAMEQKKGAGGGAVEVRDLKRPEWDVLSSRPLPRDDVDFVAEERDPPKGFESSFRCTLLLERLREVNALVGFTRVESPDPLDETSEIERAPIANGTPKLVPAAEVRGEGIFLEFESERLTEWFDEVRKSPAVTRLHAGHTSWRTARNKPDPSERFPGAVHVMAHTLAHVLMRELAMECGYGAASVRERVYAYQEDETWVAGILIYTAAPDSEGTLGGLMRLGEPAELGPLIRRALERSLICSSDPLCHEHDPSRDRSLHGAACHACTFVSETSCEFANRYLDRNLLVADASDPGPAFFTIESEA